MCEQLYATLLLVRARAHISTSRRTLLLARARAHVAMAKLKKQDDVASKERKTMLLAREMATF